MEAEPGITQRPGEGTIVIEIVELQSRHDGVYQCIASNQLGTAVSIHARLKRASKYQPMSLSLYLFDVEKMLKIGCELTELPPRVWCLPYLQDTPSCK